MTVTIHEIHAPDRGRILLVTHDGAAAVVRTDATVDTLAERLARGREDAIPALARDLRAMPTPLVVQVLPSHVLMWHANPGEPLRITYGGDTAIVERISRPRVVQ